MTAADVLAGRASWAIVHAHVLEGLRALPDASVQVCVTSPPYWGLRAYQTEPQIWGGDPLCSHSYDAAERRAMTGGHGPSSAKQITNAGTQFGNAWGDEIPGDPRGGSGTPNGRNGRGEGYARADPKGRLCARCGAWSGELGSEPTVDLFVAHLVDVFREVRRVLRNDGVCFVNIGDSFAGSGKGPTGHNGIGDQGERQGFTGPGARIGSVHGEIGHTSGVTPPPGLKAKDLCLIPFRFAIAMQEDGWWVRNDIIWAKKSAMPESVTDRCSRAHEYIFHFAKRARYYWDADAVRQPVMREWNPETNNPAQLIGASKYGSPTAPLGPHRGFRNGPDANGANLRTVWHLGPEPFPDAHFATFPTEIPRRCILAGTSERGCCPKCGASWKRMVSRQQYGSWLDAKDHAAELLSVGNHQNSTFKGKGWEDYRAPQTTGWEPSCRCDAGEPVPAIVLDPFSGSGTTAMVALRLGRRAIGLELNPEYVSMSERRIEMDSPMFNGERPVTTVERVVNGQQVMAL